MDTIARVFVETVRLPPIMGEDVERCGAKSSPLSEVFIIRHSSERREVSGYHGLRARPC